MGVMETPLLYFNVLKCNITSWIRIPTIEIVVREDVDVI
jgi:hypothetical protein